MRCGIIAPLWVLIFRSGWFLTDYGDLVAPLLSSFRPRRQGGGTAPVGERAASTATGVQFAHDGPDHRVGDT